jgi:hypothetical protein
LKYDIYVDGVRRYGMGYKGAVFQADSSIGTYTFRMPDVSPVYHLGGPGRHEFVYKLFFTDSTAVSDTTVWDIINNNETYFYNR